MTETPIRVMSVMAHQDDFEFNAGGLFALLREQYGARLHLKILTTTRGASGHHETSIEDTFRRRDAEARESAAVIGAEYECLRRLDGTHPPYQLFIDQNTLGGLWNAVRAFEPDYVFCPPVISDPLAGIHIDHYNTACAMRMIAYQLSVPHAYPTMSGPVKKLALNPVIINVDDLYARESGYDFAVDISSVYTVKEQMALCHESQVFEWLPWNAGRSAPSKEDFLKSFRERHSGLNERYGLQDDAPREFFRVTKWGRKDLADELDIILSASLSRNCCKKQEVERIRRLEV